jgi:acyl carrier protein
VDEQAIFKRIQEVLAGRQAISPDDVKWDSRLKEDLEVDSLDLVELSMIVEEEYGIEIFDEQIGGIKTVGDVVGLILESISSKK